jgi:penicillin-binding protein 1A
MLKGPVTEYNATGAKWGEMPVAGKTGTTTNSTDLWFAGLSPYLSGSVWIGYDKPTKLVGSSSGCASLWGKLMAKAHEGLESKDIEEPSGIVKVSVCKDSGLLPSSLCSQDPRGDRIREELFIEGTEPTDPCTTHVVANVNRFSNKLASPVTPSLLTKSAVFIKKDNPNPVTADYFMVLPSTYDLTDENPVTNATGDTSITMSPPIVNNPITPTNGNNNANRNKNKNKNNTHNPLGPGDIDSATLEQTPPAN